MRITSLLVGAKISSSHTDSRIGHGVTQGRSLMYRYFVVTIAALALTSTLSAAPEPSPAPVSALPRSADVHPNLQGIWQPAGTASADLQDHAASLNMTA